MWADGIIWPSDRRVRGVAVALVVLTALACIVAGPARAGTRVFPIPTTDSEPTSIISGPGGELWFTESNGYKVASITTAGRITEFPVPEGPYDTNAGEGPLRIVSSGGYLWFTSDVGESAFRMDTSGDLARVDWDGHDAIGLAASDTAGIWLFDGLASDANGNSIDLQRVDGTGTITPCETDDFNQVYAPMTLGADGSLWYAQDTTQGDYLVKLGDGCNEEVKLPIPTANATYDVTSLAFSTNGTLWFTEHAPANYNYPVGGAVGELAPGSASPRIVWSQSDLDDAAPTSLTAGPGATMYFADTDGIGQASPAGRVTFASLSGDDPASLAYGPDGNLWFVDTNANSVGAVSPASLFGGGGSALLAPSLRVAVPGQTLSTVRRRHGLTVRCTLAAAGTCALVADVTPSTARALGLRVARRASSAILARVSTTLRHRGTATLRLRVTARVLGRLRRLRRLTVTLRATSSHRGARPRSVTRRLVLR